MESTKFLFVYLTISAGLCSGKIVVKTARAIESNYFIEATEKILTSCYKTGGREVVFAGASSDNLIKTISKRTIPVSLVDETLKSEGRHSPQFKISQYGLQNFVLTISTYKNLNNTINGLKRSKWWNNMAHFLILYSPIRPDKRCFFIPTLLGICYIRGMINVKIMCLYDNERPLIINYNPYTNHGPNNWPFIRRHKLPQTRENFYSLWRKYNVEDICNGLNWDKTKNLEGFKIRIVKTEILMNKPVNESVNVNKHIDKQKNIVQNIMHFLNATPQYWDPNRSKKRTIKGMTFYPVNLHTALIKPTTYPYDMSGGVIMTQFRGHLSQLGKINIVIDSSSRWCVLVVVFITFLFFKYFMGQSFIIAILNIFRIACGASLTSIPEILSMRLYLACVFFFYITVQSFYTGQLASMLTNEVPMRNVDTMEDLIDLGHTIYAHTAYSKCELAIDPNFHKRFVGINKTDCTEYVVRDQLAACLDTADYLLDRATELRMHLTTDFVIHFYDVSLIQEDWILEEKVNEILSWQFEANIIRPLHLRIQGQTLNDFKYDDQVRNNKGIKVMTLSELTFAFVLLGIGLVFATLCCICELLIEQIKSKTTITQIEYTN